MLLAEPPEIFHTRQKRLRSTSWDIDVSLEDLCSWDTLQAYIQEGSAEGSVGVQTDPAVKCEPGHLPGGSRAAGSSTPAITYPIARVPPPSLPCADISLPVATGASTSIPGGMAMSGGMSGGMAGGMPAATLAQSLGIGWQQPDLPFPMPANHWGTVSCLPNVLGMNDRGEHGEIFLESDDGGPARAHSGLSSSPGFDCTAGADDEGERQGQKQRFVWTSDLHHRFVTAVHKLGIDRAKPQAISQLMDCDGEGAPNRQNIKSHLQKYRLLMQKRAKQDVPEEFGAPGSFALHMAAASATATADPALNAPDDAHLGHGERSATDAAAHQDKENEEFEQHLARQEMSLQVQMDLQAKLHRQLLVQRQLQHQLELSFNAQDCNEQRAFPPTSGKQPLGGQSRRDAVSLQTNLQERLTKHVLMQQEMLHHLDALVSSEVGMSAGDFDGLTADGLTADGLMAGDLTASDLTAAGLTVCQLDQASQNPAARELQMCAAAPWPAAAPRTSPRPADASRPAGATRSKPAVLEVAPSTRPCRRGDLATLGSRAAKRRQ